MKFIEYSRKIEAIKYMAAHKQTGNPIQLAEKLKVSKRTVERMVQQLRDNGMRIVYNRFRNTYELREEG